MSQKQQPQQAPQVASTVSGVEAFFKRNSKIIEWALIAVLAAVCIVLAVNKWYLEPMKAEARSQMFNAEALFREGSFGTALNGDGNILGFAQIAEQYGSKAGKVVYFYQGICNLQLGNNEEAISCLNKYSTSDKIMKARAICAIGDAQSNLGRYEDAFAQYTKAAEVEKNFLSAAYLLKAGIVAEKLGKKQEALKIFQTIKDQYSQSPEAFSVDKYISRINTAE
ncbi:MAG: tetratricopeptide repeat protein [Bacteroidales bacterium]|nr:tetratricopeptide repeat protein [Candidatus Cacconaster caballi]